MEKQKTKRTVDEYKMFESAHKKLYGDKYYKCGFEKCNFKTKEKEQLRGHLKKMHPL